MLLHDSSHKVRRQNTTEEELKRFLARRLEAKQTLNVQMNEKTLTCRQTVRQKV